MGKIEDCIQNAMDNATITITKGNFILTIDEFETDITDQIDRAITSKMVSIDLKGHDWVLNIGEVSVDITSEIESIITSAREN
jgi:hypothetical protein